MIGVRARRAARAEAAGPARPAGPGPLLELRGVDASYGPVQVLFDVELEVTEGQVVALLGANGVGKTTLLKVITGLLPAQRGQVRLDGDDLVGLPTSRIAARGISMVPGGAGVFPSLTVTENLRIASWLWPDGVPGGPLVDVLDAFPVLGMRSDSPAGDLSGGQQQILALAMALLGRPRLLLIDELSLGLAPTIVAQLVPMLTVARDQGTTVVLVEQSVDLALSVADTAAFLERGTVRFAGPAADLRGRDELLRAVFLPSAAGDGASPPEPAVGAGPASNGTAAPAARARPLVATDRPAPPGPAGSPGPATPVDAALAGTSAGQDVGRLSTDGLSRSFGGIAAVQDVTMAVRPGEILGIIGANGAGKTTLFDLICGHTPADAGLVRLGDLDVTGLPPSARARKGLGRSFQDARLFPSLAVEEVIAVACERWVRSRGALSAALRLPHAYESERRVHQRVDELINLLGLGDERSKVAGELSTGTRRIVDLACLLAHRPSVILLDEPSSGVAQREVEALAPVLEQIRAETGASLVVIEHDIPLVQTVADRLLAMDGGAVVVDGRPADVLAHPTVVAAYLGTDILTAEDTGHR